MYLPIYITTWRNEIDPKKKVEIDKDERASAQKMLKSATEKRVFPQTIPNHIPSFISCPHTKFSTFSNKEEKKLQIAPKTYKTYCWLQSNPKGQAR